MYRYLYILFALLLINCGSTTLESSPQGKQMISKQQAVKIAKTLFRELDYGPIEKYKFTITDENNKNKWSIYFEGQGEYARPGNHGIIDVDKKTGNTTHLPGE